MQQRASKMHKFSSTAVVVLLSTILFTCGFATALLITNVAEVKEAAGWAQAIGGFLAIVAAFQIGNSQSVAAMEATKLADSMRHASKCRALLALAHGLSEVSENALNVFRTRNFLLLQLHASEWQLPIKTLRSELESIKAHEFGDQTVLANVVTLKVSSSYLANVLEVMPDAISDIEQADNWNRFDHALMVADINQALIAQSAEALRQQLAMTLIENATGVPQGHPV